MGRIVTLTGSIFFAVWWIELCFIIFLNVSVLKKSLQSVSLDVPLCQTYSVTNIASLKRHVVTKSNCQIIKLSLAQEVCIFNIFLVLSSLVMKMQRTHVENVFFLFYDVALKWKIFLRCVTTHASRINIWWLIILTFSEDTRVTPHVP